MESIEKFKYALAKCHDAEKTYHELSKKTDEVRTSFLKEWAKSVAAERGTVAEKEIKSLIETEKQRKINGRIKKVVKSRKNGGPNSIVIPALTGYQRPYPKDFDYMSITHIWNRIEFDNREDIKIGRELRIKNWYRACYFNGNEAILRKLTIYHLQANTGDNDSKIRMFKKPFCLDLSLRCPICHLKQMKSYRKYVKMIGWKSSQITRPLMISKRLFKRSRKQSPPRHQVVITAIAKFYLDRMTNILE